jgi:hypothetical protein
MTKSIRWIPFTKALPPLGVPVLTKDFLNWGNDGADRVSRIVAIEGDTSKSTVLSVTRLERWGRSLHSLGSCMYYDQASWAPASGKTPTPRELVNGQRYVTRYLANKAKQEQLNREQALEIWKQKKASRRELERAPAGKIRPIESYGQRVHFQIDPEDWSLKSDPYQRSRPACGTVSSGPLTIHAHQVTCQKCRATLGLDKRTVRTLTLTLHGLPQSSFSF